MTDQQTLRHFARAVDSLPIETWSAWKLGERYSFPIALDHPNGLQAALDQALVAGCWNRGDTLAVAFSHAGRAAHTLWLYTIKQESKPVYRRDPITGDTVRSQRLYPVLVCETRLSAPLAPVEAFDAFEDDAVGCDRSLLTYSDGDE